MCWTINCWCIIKIQSLSSLVFSLLIIYYVRWLSVILYGIAFVYSLFFLPESVASVIEKNQLMVTFNMVEKKRIIHYYNSIII